MRIPQYESQASVPSTNVSQRIADVRDTSGLQNLSDGLEAIYKVKLKEQEEAQKTAMFQADTSIKMAIDEAKFNLMESIKNGGSYANAEKEYQKAHSAAVNQYISAFNVDKSGNARARAMAEYEADGLGNILQIRDAVTNRRRSDTAASASNRLDMLRREYAFAETPEERAAVASKMSGTMASLTGTGIITGDEGKMKLRAALGGAEADRLQLFAQNNSENPQAFLDEVEKSKSMLDVDTYISMRGHALNEIEKQGNAVEVSNYLSAPTGKKQPSQESVDMYFNTDILAPMNNGAIDLPTYEASVIDLSVKTHQMPTAIRNQVTSYFAMDPETMSNDDLESAASIARIVSESSKYANITPSKGVSKDDELRANLLVKRMDAGIEVREAMKSIKADVTDAEGIKLYNSGASEARRILLGNKVSGSSYDVSDIPKAANLEFIDHYASARKFTDDPQEALDQAKNQIKKRYKEFNGVMVDDPVTNYSAYSEKEWVAKTGQQFRAMTGQDVPAGAKLVVNADKSTRSMIEDNKSLQEKLQKKQITKEQYDAGLKPITYRVAMSYGENDVPVPVVDLNTGKMLRVSSGDEFFQTTTQKVFSKGSGFKTIRKTKKMIDGK